MTGTPEPDFLEFLDAFSDQADPTAWRGLGSLLGSAAAADQPSDLSYNRQLPVSCSAQSRRHQSFGLQGLLPFGTPQLQSRINCTSEEQSEAIEGAGDLLGPLLDSPPAQLLRPRDDVSVDPLEPLLEVSYHNAQQLSDLQGSSATATPAPIAPGRASCTAMTHDFSSSSSKLEGAAQEDKLSLVMQKLVDIKQRLDLLPATSTAQRKRPALQALEEELCIPAQRTQRASSPRSAQQKQCPSNTSTCSTASAISAETGMPSVLGMQPSQDFRRQLFKGIAIHPMWDELAPLPVGVIYDSTFASNRSVQLPLHHLQRPVTIGQLIELSPAAWGQLVTMLVAKLVDLAPQCLNPASPSSRHFATLAAEATIVYGIFGVVKPREVLAMFGCHLQQPEQKDRARPWAKALQEVLLHTMRAFLYGICDPWQWGHMLAHNYPYHIETMDLIQFIQTL
ncbi:hypothetical protein WJX84_007028 [Apatococcus fuscideae]|uniref:Uncharacterized protein n=1 Tax=Apatococcus fuscideae TaxID=2026836 RepID=A0AAW1T1X1_9CHLO